MSSHQSISSQQRRTENPASAGETVLRIFAGCADPRPSDPLTALRAVLVQSVESVAAAATGHVPPAATTPEGTADDHRW
jgi:hypothetical protein